MKDWKILKLELFTHLKLFLAVVIHKWLKLSVFDKMEVNDFEIVLIDGTFCGQKLVFIVLINKEKHIIGTGG